MAAPCPSNKIDSNVTGLRYAHEQCLKQLPANPVWRVQEPNSYADFGGNISTVARNPINPSRSRKKGTVTDLEASGGYNQDLTQSNTTDLLQGFFFAKAREKGTSGPINDLKAAVLSVDDADGVLLSGRKATVAAVAAGGTGYTVGQILTVVGGTFTEAAQLRVTSVAAGVVTGLAVERDGRYSATPANPVATTGGAGTATANLTYGDVATFPVNALVRATGFGVAGNNGIKHVASQTGALVEFDEVMIDEGAPPADAKLQVIGYEFAAADLSLALNGQLVRLVSAAEDMSAKGVIPGEWIFIGGDDAANRFDSSVGFARISAITATYWEFDKITWPTKAADAGTGKSVRIFYGTVIRNESDPALVVRQTYQFERTLGQDVNGTMSEYLIGAVANELTLNVQQADKVTVDLGFIGTDVTQRSGLEGLKAGSRPTLLSEDAFNTSSDFSRIKLASVSNVDAAPEALFAFSTDLTLKINNGVTANKAIGILGAFDTTAGTFEVGGDINAYFANVAAVQAVRNNADITLDLIMVKANAGLLFDVPLLSLGNGRVGVEQDQPIMIPLENMAAESKFGHTLLFQSFPYLPSVADL